ncbi:MAG: MarR family transcriptional regulator [Lapillicoccus sp.]
MPDAGPNRVNPFLGRPTPLGSLMTAAGQRLAQELNTALSEAGFPDVRAAHAPVFMAIDPEGTRITELAGRTKMTKQAVGELVRYLETRGYLTVSLDAKDARVRRVGLTDTGWRAIATGERVIAEFDAWLEQSIGAAQVERLRATLTAIADAENAVRDEPVAGQADRRRPARARR